jgi:hypothetical protein
MWAVETDGRQAILVGMTIHSHRAEKVALDKLSAASRPLD